VHGYRFSDHVDVALLFWVEVGFYFLMRALRTGSWRDIVLAGLAQGLAFLCKSYLAAIISGVALTACLLPVCRLARREDCRIGPARFLGLLGASALVAMPWLVYCMVQYPGEFWHEHKQIWKHLNSDIEGWHAPWDRLLFDYLIVLYREFYAPIVVAGVVLIGKALAQRHAGIWLIYAWGLGVLLPHLAAVTKTPSATVLAMPPLLLLLGCLVTEAWRGERWALAALTGVLAMSFVFPAIVRGPGIGYPSPPVFGGVMRQSLWVIEQVVGALIIAFVLSRRHLVVGAGRVPRFLRVATLAFSVSAMTWLGINTVRAAWRVTNANLNDPAYMDVGQIARRQLPENAVLLCEEWQQGEHLTTMFDADRTCYPLKSGRDDMARQVFEAGGIPYVVSRQNLHLSLVYVSGEQEPMVYLWQPPPQFGRPPDMND